MKTQAIQLIFTVAALALAPACFATELHCQANGSTLTGTLNDIGQIEQLTVADAAGHVQFHSDAPVGASIIQHGNYTFVLQDDATAQQAITIPPTFGQFATSQIIYKAKANGADQGPVAFVCPTSI